MIVTECPTRHLESPLLHYSTRDLAHYKHKIRAYFPLELDTMTAKGMPNRLINPNIMITYLIGEKL